MKAHPNAIGETDDGRMLFPADIRDLPADVMRSFVFVIALVGWITDGREAHETTVARCEGGSCAIRAESGEPPRDAPQ
jgi:hypothetical protein